MPWESRSVARRFFRCRKRSLFTSGSSVGPSTPQFQECSLLLPSALFSPFGMLCFSL